ncbi:MAG: leucine-rich repeat protein, partial [Planctomycetia bacterium]|nr:leucine-rich repeat protein [Planctomycetia bacterium]
TKDTPKQPEILNPKLSPQLSAIIRALLEKNPSSRPASAAAVGVALAEPIVPPPPPPHWSVVPKWAIAALVFLLVGGAVATYKLVFTTKDGTLIIEVDRDADVRFKNGELHIYDTNGKLIYTLKPTERDAKLPPGEYRVKVIGADGVELDTPEFVMKKDGRVVLRVTPKQIEVVKKKNDPKVEPKVSADPDRKAAEFILKRGGRVLINGETRVIATVENLPREQFRLTGVDAQGLNLSDEEMVCFKGCVHLKDVYLRNTQIGDAGLTHLMDSLHLEDLELRLTKVTAAKIDELKELWPRSRILWDKGNIGARAVDPDRRAAAWVLALGGTVQLNTYKDPWLTRIVELPQQPVRLLQVDLINKQRLSDTHLALFKDCDHLTHLDLRNTSVTDAGMVNFKANKKLWQLHLSNTKVTDAGLANFKGCPNMKYLALDSTQVGDEGIANFKDCSLMEQLGLSGTKVTAAGLAHFKDCKRLRQVRLGGTKVGDAGLAHLQNCPILDGLDLSETGVTDAGLAHLKDRKGLADLNLR